MTKEILQDLMCDEIYNFRPELRARYEAERAAISAAAKK